MEYANAQTDFTKSNPTSYNARDVITHVLNAQIKARTNAPHVQT